jgi:NADPH:quinone reductase-like Zn-dependent oxidoreductase
MPTQKAYRLHSYGGPDCLQFDDVPIPEPGPSQVLVAVSKVGMNPFDWKIREGWVKDEMPLPLPITIGADFAGTVVKLGEQTSRLKVGDRVMTISRTLGAYADHIAIDENILAKIPTELDDTTAGTLPMPAVTAWQALHAAKEPAKDMKILIHGASGTCGAFAVQFAKATGATVIGTASGKNRDYVLGLGADQFIDYQTQHFEELVSGIDLIVDFVLRGGDMDTTNRSFDVLNANGAMVSVADPSVGSKAPKGKTGLFPQIYPDVATLEKIAAQVSSGKVKSKVAGVYPRNQLKEAMSINEAGGTTGRLMVDFLQKN